MSVSEERPATQADCLFEVEPPLPPTDHQSHTTSMLHRWAHAGGKGLDWGGRKDWGDCSTLILNFVYQYLG